MSLGFVQRPGFSVKGGKATIFFRVIIAMTSAQDLNGGKEGSHHKSQIFQIPLNQASLRLLPFIFDLCPQSHHQTRHPCSEITGVEGKGKKA